MAVISTSPPPARIVPTGNAIDAPPAFAPIVTLPPIGEFAVYAVLPAAERLTCDATTGPSTDAALPVIFTIPPDPFRASILITEWSDTSTPLSLIILVLRYDCNFIVFPAVILMVVPLISPTLFKSPEPRSAPIVLMPVVKEGLEPANVGPLANVPPAAYRVLVDKPTVDRLIKLALLPTILTVERLLTVRVE